MDETTKLRVLHVRVGEAPEVVSIEYSLKEMQRLVGGLVECIALPDGVDVWCNEEALLVAEPRMNRWVDSRLDPIYGDFFLARHDGEGETTSLTDEDIRRWAQILKL